MAILWRASVTMKGCPMSAAFDAGRETRAISAISMQPRDGSATRSVLEIADNSSADWIDTGNGNRVLDSVHVNRARLMIDTRKWLLSKMLPKVYGDHVTVAGDPDQPIHVVQQIDWALLSDEELEAIEAFALAAQRRNRPDIRGREALRGPRWPIPCPCNGTPNAARKNPGGVPVPISVR